MYGIIVMLKYTQGGVEMAGILLDRKAYGNEFEFAMAVVKAMEENGCEVFTVDDMLKLGNKGQPRSLCRATALATLKVLGEDGLIGSQTATKSRKGGFYLKGIDDLINPRLRGAINPPSRTAGTKLR